MGSLISRTAKFSRPPGLQTTTRQYCLITKKIFVICKELREHDKEKTLHFNNVIPTLKVVDCQYVQYKSLQSVEKLK